MIEQEEFTAKKMAEIAERERINKVMKEIHNAAIQGDCCVLVRWLSVQSAEFLYSRGFTIEEVKELHTLNTIMKISWYKLSKT